MVSSELADVSEYVQPNEPQFGVVVVVTDSYLVEQPILENALLYLFFFSCVCLEKTTYCIFSKGKMICLGRNFTLS